jgi:hypothetical protein
MIVVVSLCLNIGINMLTNMYFYCKAATCFGPQQNHRQAVKQKLFKKVNIHTMYACLPFLKFILCSLTMAL